MLVETAVEGLGPGLAGGGEDLQPEHLAVFVEGLHIFAVDRTNDGADGEVAEGAMLHEMLHEAVKETEIQLPLGVADPLGAAVGEERHNGNVQTVDAHGLQRLGEVGHEIPPALVVADMGVEGLAGRLLAGAILGEVAEGIEEILVAEGGILGGGEGDGVDRQLPVDGVVPQGGLDGDRHGVGAHGGVISHREGEPQALGGVHGHVAGGLGGQDIGVGNAVVVDRVVGDVGGGGDTCGEGTDLQSRDLKGGIGIPQTDLPRHHHIAGGVEGQGGGVLGPLAGVLEDLGGGGLGPDIHRGSPFGDDIT